MGRECTLIQAGCVSSSESGSIVKNVLSSVLENLRRGELRNILGVYLEVC
jgi:hypothetical protein